MAAAALALSVAAAAQDKPSQFWNLTSNTVTGLRLSLAGGPFGEDFALKDADGIDHDERLRIAGLASGAYDAQLRFKGGRLCLARGVKIAAGKVFSIEDKNLVDCK